MSAPLTDAETAEAIELWRRNIAQDSILTDAELLRLDSLAQRIRIRRWPPVILQPGQLPPSVTIPKAYQQIMVCQQDVGGGPVA